jgi:hypothetical protein
MHGFGTITDRKGAKYKGNFYNGLRCVSDDNDDDVDDTLPRDIMIIMHELLT